MKLYDYGGAPNPRRVHIFLAEKGMEVERVHVDIMQLEQKSEAMLARNPSGKIPVLETDDGRHIAESVAICRYLEALQPEPNLFGRDAYELGYIESRNRQIELELWTQIGTSWVNGPIVARSGRFEQIPAAKEASDKNVLRYYERLDREFADSAWVAGNRFSVADISLVCAIDFASTLVGLPVPNGLEHLSRWHADVAARPSYEAK